MSEQAAGATTPTPPARRRGLYCVLSARSLPYASKCFESLFAHAAEPVALTLITDGEADRREIGQYLASLAIPGQHAHAVFAKEAADERAAALFGRHPNLLQFRSGHPCWRKITDPVLFAPPGEEMIILDPDLYFPNFFRFEQTLDAGLQLMWQPPSCLLPDAVVRTAYGKGIALAHHVDIGVAQLRNDLDLDWLDWLVGALGGAGIPRAMHVEAIVWAALAMRMGGSYLNPVHWHCWQYRQWKRLALKLGVAGTRVLGAENFGRMKCFHAGGVAKWFVKDACDRGLFPAPTTVEAPLPESPYEELTRDRYESDQRIKHIARRLGYYRLFRAA